MYRWWKVILPSILLLFAVVLRYEDPVLLQEFRYRIFDNFQRLSPRIYTQVPITIVDIDDETLKRQGQWPWPRTLVAELVARILNAGGVVVALDMVFPEPDRTSPENLISSFADGEAARLIRAAIGNDPLANHDAVFADLLSQAPTVVGFIPVNRDTGRIPGKKVGLATAGDDPLRFLRAYPGAVTNLPVLDDAVSGVGGLTPIFDTDGVIRRVPLFVSVQGQIYPSLATEALRVAQGASTVVIKSSGASGETAFGEHTGVNQVKIGQFVAPTDAESAVWLRDTGDVRNASSRPGRCSKGPRPPTAWKARSFSSAPARRD